MTNLTEMFILDYGDGTRCKATIDFSKIEILPPDELPNLVKMDCEGLWDRTHFDAYVEWVADLWQQIADRANQPISSSLYWPKGESVLVICEPGSRPEFHSSLQLSLW